MNLLANPDLLDRLAAAYALGTLRGGARRRFETLARQSPTARAAALIWQQRLAAMTELQAGEAPSPNVWKRIENLIAAQRSTRAAAVPAEPPKALGWWRGAALAGGLASVVAVVVAVQQGRQADSLDQQLAAVTRQSQQAAQQNAQLVAQLRAQPEVRYVAVLADEKSIASILATYDPKHSSLTIKRVAGGVQEGPDKSLQVWVVPVAGGPPKSLGVLGTSEVDRLMVLENQVGLGHNIAVSLEPKGGVPSDRGPTGPVLFKGPVLQTAL
jgi:anti-sigma-K factor RskA